MGGGYAWVTLATNDSYSLGALVLAHSLKQVGTKQQLAVLITPGVTSPMRAKLNEVFNVVKEVNILDSKDEANLKLLKRPELGITFTKLHCWRLTQYEKCVFLDADTLVLQNCDELFDKEEFSAAPDIGWPDCFNSGVFVYRPSNDTYEKLIQFALEKGSFDGGDQGLLNLYFSDWAHKDISKHLPFIYNMSSTACYSYLPAFKQFGKNAKIIHFIGSSKPWLQYFNTETRKVHPSEGLNHLAEILQLWWNIFCDLIHPKLSPDMAGLAGAFANLTLGQARTPEQQALDDHLRRQGWEVGNIDYLGKDSFENIWSKICETLSEVTEKEPSPTKIEEKSAESIVEPVAATSEKVQSPAQTSEAAPLPAPSPPTEAPKSVEATTPPSEEPVKGPETMPSSVIPISEPAKSAEPKSAEDKAAPVQETTTSTDSPAPEPALPIPVTETPIPVTETPVPAAILATEKPPSVTPAGAPETASTAVLKVAAAPATQVADSEAAAAPTTPTAVSAVLKAVPEPPTVVKEAAVAPPTTPILLPEEPAAVLETPAAVPETPAAVSETPAAVPKTPVSVPETPVTVPETPVEVPGTQAAVPGTQAAVPGTPAAVPEIPAAAPDTSSAVTTTPITAGVPSTTTPEASKLTEIPQTTPITSPELTATPTVQSTPSTEVPKQVATSETAKTTSAVAVSKISPVEDPKEVPAEAPKTSAEAPKTSVEIQTTPTVEAPKEVPAEAPKTPAEAPKTSVEIQTTPTESPKALKEAEKKPEVTTQPPTAKVTEATPPTTPSTPTPKTPEVAPAAAKALAVDTSVPETPPPAATEAASPTPPPRKSGGAPKKSGGKKK